MHANNADLASAASAIERLHRESAGSTYSLHGGSLQGYSGFAVSPHPDRWCKLNTRWPTADEFFDYITQNIDLLELADCCLGSWVNEDAVTEIDVVRVVQSKAHAIIIGLRTEQRYIFDLKNGVEIRVSVFNLMRALLGF